MTEQRVSPARMLAELLADATGRSWVEFDFKAEEIVKAIRDEIEENLPEPSEGLGRWDVEDIADDTATEAAEEVVKDALTAHEQRFHAWPERQQVIDEILASQEVPHA